MPTIILREIECYDPREIHDEPYLRVDTDSLARRVVWGPDRMGRGDRIDLTHRVEPIVYYDLAHISLREEDRVGRDDHYGTMTFFSDPGIGVRDFYFPGNLNSRYRLNYEVLRDPVAPIEGEIELLSLTCNDPQGTKDEITLRVNDHIVAGPMRRMRKNWAIHFSDVTVSFRRSCVIKLKDTQGQDWERSMELVRGEYPLDTELSHNFIAGGRGIVGDASYTLMYRMIS